jgi:uncharacterized protein
LLALNLFWGLVDILLLHALARGVRFRSAVGLAFAASLAAFLVDCGFFPLRFHAMGTASFAIFLHAPLVLLGAAWVHRRSLKRALPSLAASLGLAFVAADAFLYEPHALVTSTYDIKAREGVRIVVMSDFQAIHIGDYERSVLLRVAELQPELLLLAGDYIQVYGERREGVVREFRQAWEEANIHPRLGVFAVRGDVEPDGWEDELFGGLDVVTSDPTKTFDAGGLTLTLLSLRDSGNRRLSLSRSSASTNIVLGHRPDFALGNGPAGLLVAGHTHGGQVQLPFWGPPIILSAVPRQWGGGGLHVVDAERSLLVTRGAGIEHADDAPALRFNCRPEIVALNMIPSPQPL